MANGIQNNYAIPQKLVHWLITACLTSIAIIGVYMVQWNANDREFKREVYLRLQFHDQQINRGILPNADKRVSSLEQWKERHERKHP